MHFAAYIGIKFSITYGREVHPQSAFQTDESGIGNRLESEGGPGSGRQSANADTGEERQSGIQQCVLILKRRKKIMSINKNDTNDVLNCGWSA